MSNSERFIKHAAGYAKDFVEAAPTARPASEVAVVACMDARIDVFSLFGLKAGDCHVIRNAGGSVNDDTLRSLVISQRFLGTKEIILVHHTGCGMLGFTDDELADQLEAETGHRPSWRAGAFTDLAKDVRISAERIRTSPFLLHRDQVRGFIFEVETGELKEVDLG